MKSRGRWRSFELRVWNGAVDREMPVPIRAALTVNYAREESTAPLGPIPAPLHRTLSCRSMLELGFELRQILEGGSE